MPPVIRAGDQQARPRPEKYRGLDSLKRQHPPRRGQWARSWSLVKKTACKASAAAEHPRAWRSVSAMRSAPIARRSYAGANSSEKGLKGWVGCHGGGVGSERSQNAKSFCRRANKHSATSGWQKCTRVHFCRHTIIRPPKESPGASHRRQVIGERRRAEKLLSSLVVLGRPSGALTMAIARQAGRRGSSSGALISQRSPAMRRTAYNGTSCIARR
jgi:hypothetical protein